MHRRADRAARRALGACGGAAVLAFTACQDPAGPVPDPGGDVPDVRPYVIGEALAALDGRGRFVFPAPAATDGVPLIGPEQARGLGAVYLSDVAREPAIAYPCAPGVECATVTKVIERAVC